MLAIHDTLQRVDMGTKASHAIALSQITKAIRGGDVLTSSARSDFGIPGISGETHQQSKQYTAFYGLPYAAIRPIATRVAGQAMKIGRKSMDRSMGSMGLRTKSQFYCQGKSVEVCDIPDGQRSRKMKSDEFLLCPDFIQKSTAYDGYEVIDEHPILLDFAEPNPSFTKWQLFYCVAASVCLTGKALILIEPRSAGRFFYWYIPSHWAEPIHSPQPYAKWKITPTGREQSFEVSGDEVIFFNLPDPGNPLRSYSPTQAQARPINADDQIQESHYATLRNVINPKVILKAGRIDNPISGRPDQRVLLTPEQRTQLINSVLMYYQGAMKMGHPFIVDGMVEEITPFMNGPSDLDYPQGSQAIEDRIFLGFGVSKTVAGRMEGANRATAYTAHTGVNDLVINPMIEMMSQVLTRDLGRLYREPSVETAIWIERARAFDAELQMRRVQMGLPALTRGEMRHYISTGEVRLSERDDDDELMPSGAAASEDPAEEDKKDEEKPQENKPKPKEKPKKTR